MKNKLELEAITRVYVWESDDHKFRAKMNSKYNSDWDSAKCVEFEMARKGDSVVQMSLVLRGKPLTEAQEQALFDDMIGTALVYDAGGGVVPE